MKSLKQILLEAEDGEEYILTFSCGDQLGLMDFEIVDKSIYGRTDLCIADVASQIKCDRRFYTVGTKIEFSLNDVLSIVAPKSREPTRKP